MGCLWLTLADPEPAINGQFIYSAGLISSVAQAGMNLTVLGLAREPGARRRRVSDGIDFLLAEDRPMPRWERLLSTAPMVATRCQVPDMEASVRSCLADETWEAVVFDSIAAAWAWPMVRRYRDRYGAKLVYLSHNHETGVASALAVAARGLRWITKQVDAWKVARLEGELIRACDLVTANTPEDRRTMEGRAPAGKPVIFLPPGYGGTRLAARTIDRELPRRAVVVGSFDWLPKRISLEAFLAVAVPLFVQAGVELQIVGGAQPDYIAGLRRRYPAVEFTGMVPDVRPYMANARLALVPDLIGGFKLKSLDYVFNRLPIFAMDGAVPGTPMMDGESIRLFPSHEALARSVVHTIDDVDALNAQQNMAVAACADRFDWANIGRLLVESIRSLPRRWPAQSFASRRPILSAMPRASSDGRKMKL